MILSETRTAIVETAKYGESRPVIVVLENGRRTPGQWFATTIAESTACTISIDFSAHWDLTETETALLIGFAIDILKSRGLR